MMETQQFHILSIFFFLIDYTDESTFKTEQVILVTPVFQN